MKLHKLHELAAPLLRKRGYGYVDAAAKRRARYHWNKNVADPGDIKDPVLLAGIAIATAHVGYRAGWIPEVQSIGCEICECVPEGTPIE